MFLRDAAQSDLVVGVGKERWRIPLFTIDDFTAWGAEMDLQRLELATKGMDEKTRFQYVALYFVPDTGLNELIRLLATPAGVKRVCQTCLVKATIITRDGKPLTPPEPLPSERAQAVLAVNARSLPLLVEKLAPTSDPAELKETDNESTGSEEGETSVDPLPSPGAGPTAASVTSESIGVESSVSSEPSIPEPASAA